MPQLRSVSDLADLARAFATRYAIVEYMHHLYMPVHFLTREPLPTQPDETVWVPVNDKALIKFANVIGDILFATESEFKSYKFMVRQFSSQQLGSPAGLLVRMERSHVALLNEHGDLVPVTGDFVPNYVDVSFNMHATKTEELFKYISDWVGSEEQAHSLLYHLSTALQINWSARKYVLLIGDGKNGKSTLLKMLYTIFGGDDNISGVTRQMMSAQRPTVAQLNGKVFNVVFDGPKEFLKDTSTEKTLIAGEPVQLELKYENIPVRVQTNALFIEGLNDEPNLNDKSAAIQERLVRYRFNNKYKKDLLFEEKMLSDEMLTAMVQLLLAHWVNKNELDEKLSLTAESLDLQLQAVWSVSPLLRFLEWMSTRSPDFLRNIKDKKMPSEDFMDKYRTWLENNGYRNMEDDFVLRQLKNNFVLDRKTFRVDGKPTTKRYIKSVMPDTLNAINTLLEGNSLEEGASTEDLEVLRALEE